MRIIAGTHRGRPLAAPPGRGTRPMLDRVREALFSTVHTRLPGCTVLDLFAGSGSLGLEALSRGAAGATFVERDPKALKLLRRNVDTLGETERSQVRRGDALDSANWGSTAPDLVFFDPPYPLLEDRDARRDLLDTVRRLVLDHGTPQALVVFHTPRRALGAAEFGPGLALREREYGTNALWYVERDSGLE